MILVTMRRSPASESAVFDAYGTRCIVLLVLTLSFVAASGDGSAAVVDLVRWRYASLLVSRLCRRCDTPLV